MIGGRWEKSRLLIITTEDCCETVVFFFFFCTMHRRARKTAHPLLLKVTLQRCTCAYT